jgi:hypothetical protein
MENPSQNIGVQKVAAIAALMNACQAPESFHRFRDDFLGALYVYVLDDQPQISDSCSALNHFEQIIRRSPLHSMNEIVASRIVRDLTACFAIACPPQHVHVLLEQRMIAIVRNSENRICGSLFSTSLYCLATLTGIVKGLCRYWNITNFNGSDSFCTAGEKVGQCFAVAHTESQLCGPIIPEMESDLGKEVVAISHIMANPFGRNFLTSIWKGLGEKGRGGLFNQQYALTRAIIMAFVMRHLARLSVDQLMGMIVPIEPVQPS